MNFIIRGYKATDIKLLETFLYEAIYIPKGKEKPSRDIILKPELQIYIKGFGFFKDDLCLLAEVDDQVVGAIWTRIMNDYGHIDDSIPSLSLSVLKDYRGYGIGSELLNKMLIKLRDNNYHAVSLSVQKDNYAVNIYKKAGFEIFKENADEYIMVCKL